MSGTASTSMAVGIGGAEVGYWGYNRSPFTAVQWQELEHQAMIYKYLVAGVPVPPDLIMPIRRSFDALSAHFFHPSLGYGPYFGKKFDPEPGRCRRTDGKKWRCSKDAHPDSKYCERHMHRGRARSRKPVESQSNTQSLSTTMAHISSGSSCTTGSCFQIQNVPLYSGASSDGSSLGCNVTKQQMEPISYGIDNKEFRYIQGLALDADNHSYSPDAAASVGNLGLGSSAGNGMWRFMPSHTSSSSMLKQKPDSQLLGHSMSLAYEPTDTTLSRQPQQHCFLESEIVSACPVKQDQHPVHPFFSEWPTTKEPWPALEDEDCSGRNFFSSTQLSISIPRSSSDISSRSTYSPNDS